MDRNTDRKILSIILLTYIREIIKVLSSKYRQEDFDEKSEKYVPDEEIRAGL
jgi:hypothetical protein